MIGYPRGSVPWLLAISQQTHFEHTARAVLSHGAWHVRNFPAVLNFATTFWDMSLDRIARGSGVTTAVVFGWSLGRDLPTIKIRKEVLAWIATDLQNKAVALADYGSAPTGPG